MARPLFNRIVNEVTNHDAYFRDIIDCTRKEGISLLLKCTSAIRQLTYGINADFLDEYLQMSERSSRISLDHFCKSVMEIFVPEYMRKPTGYYLVDGIYPELAILIKTNPEPADDDHKRILYKLKQESSKKDVERAFGVLKKK
ncbi:serine/threonine-protein kinase STY17-like protein [Tanacetum coccineum]